MKLFLENIKRLMSFHIYFVNPSEVGSKVEEGPKQPENQGGGDLLENQEWFQKLSPEKQNQYKEASEKLDEFKKQYEIIIATKQITKQTIDSLLVSLTSDPSIKSDPDAQPTIDMFNHYKKQYQTALSQEGDVSKNIQELNNILDNLKSGLEKLEFDAGIDIDKDGKVEEMGFTEEDMKTIKNEEFLKLLEAKRLQYITKGNIDSNRVSSGEVKELTFSFDMENNKQFYLDTTAGQVLPKEVREINLGQKTYIREGLKGEFFTGGGERFTIHDGTHISNFKLGTVSELENIHHSNSHTHDSILREYPAFANHKDKIMLMLNKGLGVEEIKILGEHNLTQFDNVQIEIFSTNLLREKDFLDLLKEKNQFPKNIDELNKVLEISSYLRISFGKDANLNDFEKIDFYNKTKKMSINQISDYIEQKDNTIGRTNLNYDNVGKTYFGKVKNNPEGMTGRVKLKDVIPNTSLNLNSTYDKYTLDKVPKNTQKDVSNILKTFPNPNSEWLKVICRNAIKNPNFSDKKPFIAQNLSYKTAIIYYPGESKANIIPVVHGVGRKGIGEVSNVSGSHGSSLGSKDLVAQGGGKYKFRVVVRGLEPIKKKVFLSRGEAMNLDPSEIGNSNDLSRVIRIHEQSRGKFGTRGCSGLIPSDAKKLHDKIKQHGGGSQEIFVSKV